MSVDIRRFGDQLDPEFLDGDPLPTINDDRNRQAKQVGGSEAFGPSSGRGHETIARSDEAPPSFLDLWRNSE